MREMLAEIVTRSGVEAAFVCDSEGSVLASAPNEVRYKNKLDALSGALARANTALRSLKHDGIAEIEWVYAGGRVLVRGVDHLLLCLICERSTNLQLLTMKLEEVTEQIRSTLGSKSRDISPQDIVALKKEMSAIARQILGEHADKVIAIVQSSGSTLDNLKQACDQSEKVTRLFIDRKNADELGARMRALIDKYR
jgi:predicted regulator of Ras-like GTPase activity (Roadblock/LC7/MglB family)